jgi:hypothetical protein
MLDLPTAFSVWAGIVGLIGIAIVWELTRLRNDLRELTGNLNKYILSMERRVTHIESHMAIKHEDFKPITQ